MSRVAGWSTRRPYFVVAFVVLAADQITKIIAHNTLRDRGSVEVIPNFFNLYYSRNPGGLFGYFSSLGEPWRAILLTLMPLVAVGLIGAMLLRSNDPDRFTLPGLGLILGGATGNLVDRVFRGEVVDFLDVYAPSWLFADWFGATFGTRHWPTFNVADSAIVVGAGLLLIDIVRSRKAEAPTGSS